MSMFETVVTVAAICAPYAVGITAVALILDHLFTNKTTEQENQS